MFAAGPPLRLGGTLSVNPYCNVQESGALYSKDSTNVNQGSSRAAATTTTKKKMVEKVPLKRSAALYEENSNIFLILPSYAAKHKVRIREILTQEKEKLCSNKKYNQIYIIFSDVQFKIAYTNDRNIKNMIVRTKL